MSGLFGLESFLIRTLTLLTLASGGDGLRTCLKGLIAPFEAFLWSQQRLARKSVSRNSNSDIRIYILTIQKMKISVIFLLKPFPLKILGLRSHNRIRIF